MTLRQELWKPTLNTKNGTKTIYTESARFSGQEVSYESSRNQL